MPQIVKDGRFNFGEDPDHVFVIAEVGVNNDGDRTRSIALTDMARECGADLVKFQAFDPPWLCNVTTAQAGYQLENQKGLRESEDSFLDLLYRYEMSRGALIDPRKKRPPPAASPGTQGTTAEKRDISPPPRPGRTAAPRCKAFFSFQHASASAPPLNIKTVSPTIAQTGAGRKPAQIYIDIIQKP